MPGTDAKSGAEPHDGRILYEWKPVRVPCPTCGAKMKLYCCDAHVRYFKCLRPGCKARLTIMRERPTAEKS